MISSWKGKLGLSLLVGIGLTGLSLYQTYRHFKKIGLHGPLPLSLSSTDKVPEPFICKFYNHTGYRLVVKGGQPFPGQQLNPPQDTKIDNNSHYDYCLFYTISLETTTEDGKHIQSSNIILRMDSYGNTYLLDLNNNLLFTYDPDHSYYSSSDPWKQLHAMSITAPNINLGPPIISNN